MVVGIGLAWMGDGQSWSNFVGERSGPVNEGRIRSSKSGDGWAGLILSRKR